MRLALCTPDGEVLGALPSFPVETPWWMDVVPVIAGARERFDVDITILRLVETDDRWPPRGGPVTYLAETDDRPNGLAPVAVDMGDHPLRARWARPGGVAALVAWADRHITRTGPPQQVRTWNLSLVVQLPTADGPVWLKAVPPFFAHEGAVIEAMGAIASPLVARDDGVVLLADVPGPDHYAAPQPWMVERWVRAQHEWTVDLVDVELPSWRRDDFISLAEPLVDSAAVAEVVAGLPQRFDALEACGLPDTLVHGDFHAGNWRGTHLLDWGDSGVGHPLLDQAAFGALPEVFVAEWKRHRPASDPERAAALVAPIAALRQAHTYRMFLENIEPSEHCYHRNDTAEWLARAVQLSRSTT